MIEGQEIVEVRKAIAVALEKLSYKRRRQRAHARNIRTMERRMREAVNKYLKLMEQRIKAGVSRLSRRGTPTKIVQRLVDWEALKREGEKLFAKPLLSVLGEGGQDITSMRMVKQETFDPIGAGATSWATEHSAELVTGITVETMEAMREVVTRGIDQGLALQQMQRELRLMVGLNERQAVSASKALGKMVEAGLSDAEIKKRLARYVNKAHRYRAMMIARTETAQGLSQGTLQGYSQMGIKRVEWVADPDCCDVCSEMSGKTFSMADAEGQIPAHPNCECVWVMAS